jgi:hypothetical protein
MKKNNLKMDKQKIFCLAVILLTQFPKTLSAQDIGWPRQVENNGSVLIYYQPQVDQWNDYKEMTASMAFTLTPKGQKQAVGVASFQCTTSVDKDKRIVYFQNIEISSVRFSSLEADDGKAMDKLFRELMPVGQDPISLDRVMADIKQEKVENKGVPINNDPPKIFYSATPAILLIVDGKPVLVPIEKTKIQYVVNSNWDLFFDLSKSDYYLLANKTWLKAKDIKGPWTQTLTLPKEMDKLPNGQNFDDVKKTIPAVSTSEVTPQVYFSDKPAELILLKGSPVYSKIPNTQLLYVTNTGNDLFVNAADKQFYILLSGRWFKSAAFSGPWSYAGDDFPKDFAKIPENSPKAHVLASVPGTQEASDAVMLAQIPRTAIINRSEAEAKVNVVYDGDPAFKPIETTTLEYATNTQEKVIKVGDLYYLCFQAVWFMSTKPSGPWKTAESVPKEIYSIPPSSPIYNVTYVIQTNPTPTTVQSSYTDGYLGMFVLGVAVGACIAYGTGFYHSPFYYWGPGLPYPVYRPWPMTYGAGVVYNPWTGGFAAGRVAYGPYGSAGSAAWYNPATGRYGRSASVQGPYGGRTAASTYNPWTGGYAATRQGHNSYAQWGSSVATRGNQGIQTAHVTTANGTALGYRTASGNAGVITHGANGTTVHTNNNNVYAGHDGNVYKNTNGSWSQYNKGNWDQVHNTNTTGGLSNSANARQRGNVQANQFQNFQSRGGRPSGGHRGRR